VRSAGLHVAILADGDAPPRARLDAAWPGWDDGIDWVIAADGGARHGAALGLRIDAWVGDGDSVDATELEALASAGAELRHVAVDKDESDAELALASALDRGAGAITILGALGGARIDHALANLGLLHDPELDDRFVRLYDGLGSRLTLLVAAGSVAGRSFEGRRGDLVSILALAGPATGVRTEGLRYPLTGEPLQPARARGLSNVRTSSTARISLQSGRLLVIETPVTVEP
jgi:thiamine pyrophosphokinase